MFTLESIFPFSLHTRDLMRLLPSRVLSLVVLWVHQKSDAYEEGN